MTEESKMKLKKLVDNTKTILEILVEGDICNPNTRPTLVIIFNDAAREESCYDLYYSIDFMTEEFGRNVTVPSMIYLWHFESDDNEDVKEGCSLVYNRGEWFI